jgi:hypothetical protein
MVVHVLITMLLLLIVSPRGPLVSISPIKSGAAGVGTLVALKLDGRENKLH